MTGGQGARRWLVPEVVQTSAMDCGPAALKCLLEGFGVAVSYGRLREACQTDVDGTSIDTLEDIAGQLGLQAEQVMLPPEHLFLAEADALPAIVVVRLPGGMTHFVVVWGALAGRAQVMDPGVGRRWPGCARLMDELHRHTAVVPAVAFRTWVEGEDFLGPIGVRLAALGVPGAGAVQRAAAVAEPGWRSLAALDAAARYVELLVRSGELRRGPEAARLVDLLLAQTRAAAPGEAGPIPEHCWSARPGPSGDDGEERVLFRGAVLLRVRGRIPQPATPAGASADTRSLSPALAAALEEPANHAWRILRGMLREDGLLAPAVLASSLAVATGVVVLEALLFRGLLQIGRELPLPGFRLGAAIALLLFLMLVLAIELPLVAGVLRLGRHFEGRMRVAFLAKIPRLGDRYFQSRPASDMAERGHAVHTLRGVPALGARILRACFGLIVTVLAIVWVDRGSVVPVLVIASASLLLPLVVNRVLIERDLRVRTHTGALTRFYLDALLGLVPIRAHTAERAVRREHESLLGEWALAGRAVLRAALAAEALMTLIGSGAAVWLIFDHVARVGAGPQALLLVYWALALPGHGQELAAGVQQYPGQRNVALRLLEPLGAPDDVDIPRPDVATPKRTATSPMDLAFAGVSVRAGGHTILDCVDFTIAAGSHVAIVGPSGAGKSSLVGVLLGWHPVAAGRVLVDGVSLDGAGLDRLRRETAWVDPAIHLWNRTFLENLRYGAINHAAPLGDILEAAELRDVLERLPDGQQTMLGEGGGLVSGGQGQRIRLGRAMLRRDARLVLLDEPFRGLDRDRRRALLTRARQWWQGATLLCVTHDVGETMDFERVLVIDGGRVVEDGCPAELAARHDSRYRALLDAETVVREGLWSAAAWRRLRLEQGRLVATPRGEAP